MIRALNSADLKDIESLALEVEKVFGKMVGTEEFNDAIEYCINNGLIFGYENTDTTDLCGAISISKENNEIVWFVVKENSRGLGIGDKLLAYALSELDRSKAIYVQTFSAQHPEGKAARKLYMKYGFVEDRDGGKNFAKMNTVIMRLS